MTGLWRRLAGLWRRRQLDAEFAEELAAHLALKERALRRAGAEDPSRMARIALGDPLVWRERIRDVWSLMWLEGCWRDIRFGARLLWKEKTFTGVVLITLGLGIGANTAVFSLLNGLLLRSLPVRAPEELVRLSLTNLPPGERAWTNGREVRATERTRLSYPFYRSVASQTKLLNGVFGVTGTSTVTLEWNGIPRQVVTSNVTGSYFPVLGVRPRAGRLLEESDDVSGGPQSGWTAVVSEEMWENGLAVGSHITVERIPFTVVGVAPREFAGVQPGKRMGLWLPLSSMEVMYPRFQWRNEPGMGILQIFGRRFAGEPVEAVSARLTGASRSLLAPAMDPEFNAKQQADFLAMQLKAIPGQAGSSDVADTYGKALWMLMAAVGAVLLIGATNLANLMLARASRRAREIAVRLALGASKGAIRRQLLIESLLLGLGGTALGLMMAGGLARGLQRGISGGQALVQIDSTADWRLALFLSAALLAVVLVAGLAPAWTAIRASLGDRGGGGRGLRIRSAMIVLQTGLAFALLGGAGLLLESVRALMTESTGFGAERTILLMPDLLNAGVDRHRQEAVYVRLLEGARRTPQVESAAWTRTVPLTGSLNATTVEVPGKMDLPPRERMLFTHVVSDGYFGAMGIPMLAGSDLAGRGGRSAVAVISENAARKLYGDVRSAVGQRLRTNENWLEIVGVVANTKYQHVRESPPMTMYLSLWNESSGPGMTMAVRYSGSAASAQRAMEALFAAEAGRKPLVQVQTINGNITASARMERLLASLLGSFGGFALLIVLTGLAGMLAYSVEQRRREIGVRLAVGASPSRIRSLFQRQGLMLSALGVMLGGGLAWALRRSMDAYLFRTEPGDLRVWTAAAGLLLLTGLAAAALPAWRASRIDPMEALRTE